MYQVVRSLWSRINAMESEEKEVVTEYEKKWGVTDSEEDEDVTV